MSFKEGVLFTNSKLNNELLFMTGKSFTSEKKCLSSFKVFKIDENSLIFLSDVDENNLTTLDDLKYDFINYNTFTRFNPSKCIIDDKSLKQIGFSTGSYAQNLSIKDYYLQYIQVEPEYRDFGIAKSLMEVIKTFAKYKGLENITGTMVPLDTLKNKNPVRPAKNVERQVYHYESIFSIYDEFEQFVLNSKEEPDDYDESVTTLKEIYTHLGFSVKLSSPKSNSGTLKYSLKNYKPTDNKDFIISTLCNDESDLTTDAILDEFSSDDNTSLDM